MASAESVRALRSLLRSTSRPQQIHLQRRRLCTECLAAKCSVIPRVQQRRDVPSQRPTGHTGTVAARRMATMADYRQQEYKRTGPIAEYDARVHSGRLRDDEHQRSLIQALQDLHDTLMKYKPHKVVHPTIESLQPKKRSLFG